MNLTKWLFLLSLILFPLGELIRIPIVKDIVVKPFDVAVVLTSFYFGITMFLQKKKMSSTLLKPIVFFAGAGFLSLLINVNQLTSTQFLVAFSYLVRWIAYAGIFFVVSSFDEKFKKRILNFLIFDGIIVLLLGFAQYVFYPDLRNLYYLGWDEHLYRLFSTFLDPNFTATYLTLFFILLLSSQNLISFFKKNIILFSTLTTTLVAIVLTYSRSGILMFAVCVGVFLILQKKIKTISLVFLMLLLFLLVSTRLQFSEGTNLLRTASIISRFDSYEEALKIIQSSPVFGVGFNAYKYSLERENIDKPTKALQQHANAGTDSSLLFVFATTGVVGLCVYIYLLKSIMLFAFMKYKKGNVLALGVFASFAGLLINSLFINSLFYTFIMFWMWAQLGLIEKD